MSVPCKDEQVWVVCKRARRCSYQLCDDVRCVPEASPVLHARGTARPLGFRLSGPSTRTPDSLALILLQFDSSPFRRTTVYVQRYRSIGAGRKHMRGINSWNSEWDSRSGVDTPQPKSAVQSLCTFSQHLSALRTCSSRFYPRLNTAFAYSIRGQV